MSRSTSHPSPQAVSGILALILLAPCALAVAVPVASGSSIDARQLACFFPLSLQRAHATHANPGQEPYPARTIPAANIAHLDSSATPLSQVLSDREDLISLPPPAQNA
ncbi:hypothetical protein [Mucisphaera sp.]|uniref:hypothetical protein n=1 Tax=Mucisphaera sp. TaxID=2913024 RepID=UPI003D0FED9F